MREPTKQDIRAADRANLYGGGAPFDLTLRAAADAQLRAYHRAEKERIQTPTPRHFQPFEGAVIERDREPYFGGCYAAGIYIADYELAKRAQRALVERDHLEALRRNDWLDRQRVRFELTDSGRAELATPDRVDAEDRVMKRRVLRIERGRHRVSETAAALPSADSETSSDTQLARGVYSMPFRANGYAVLVAIDSVGNRVLELPLAQGVDEEEAWGGLRALLDVTDPVPGSPATAEPPATAARSLRLVQ